MRCGTCITGPSKPIGKALELTRALVETGIDGPEAVARAEVTLKNAGGRGHQAWLRTGAVTHTPSAMLIRHARFQLLHAGEEPCHAGSHAKPGRRPS